MNRVYMPDLPSEVYEHPFDKAALSALKALPGFDTVANFFLNWLHVKWEIIAMQGSHFHVTRESCPELYRQVKMISKILGVKDFPEIYSQWGYQVNACTTGTKEDTMLILNSGAVDLLSDSQLNFVIGHEMGHIKSGHVLYHVMASFIGEAISMIPLGDKLLQPIKFGLLYWSRMSEFTSDRAGMLACQDKDGALDALIKLSGMPMKYFKDIDKKAFIRQADEFENELGGMGQAMIKTISIATSSHPWVVRRVGMLIKWLESGEYDAILNKYGGILHSCGNVISRNAKECPYCGLLV